MQSMEIFADLRYYPNAQYYPLQPPSGYVQNIPKASFLLPLGMNFDPIPPPHFIHPTQQEYLAPPMNLSFVAINPSHYYPPNDPHFLDSSSSAVAPRPPMRFANPPGPLTAIHPEPAVMEAKAIEVFEYYLSTRNMSSDWYLQSLMDSDLWIPLKDILPFRRMHLCGIRTLSELQRLATKASNISSHTNVKLDSSNMFVRPKWADWSEIKIKASFANRSMKKTKRKKFVRNAIQQALGSIMSGQKMILETERPVMSLFGREKDGTFRACFTAPGVPSLIAPFLTKYEDTDGTMFIIETTNSVFDVDDFFHAQGLEPLSR